MKKIILLLSIITLMVTSCSSDNSPAAAAPIDETDNILLKKTIMTEGSVVTTDVYSYTGKKIIKIASSNGTTTDETQFTYTGDLITKIEIFSNAVLKLKKEYTYQNDKMTQIITYTYGGAQTTKDRTDYSYVNNDDVLYKIFRINMTNNQETMITEGEVSFFAGDIDNRFNTDYPIIAGRITDVYSVYSHDSKKCPTRNITGFTKMIDNDFWVSYRNVSNIKLTKDVYINGVWTPQTVNLKRSYKYLDTRFPYEGKIYNKNEALVSTTQYFYE